MPAELAALARVERSGIVTRITLNRADKRNALSSDLVETLLDNVKGAYADGTRLLVLRGAGKSFSAGFDFSRLEDQSEGDLLRRFVRIEQLLQTIAHAPFDTLAYAHGRNFGAGVDLFAACNRRWAAPDTEFCMPGLGFGLVLGSNRFADIVGSDWARKVLYDGLTFNTETALTHGFVTDKVESNNIEHHINSIANPILNADSAVRLFRVVRIDTRDRDMAELVASAVKPGIKERIRAYRKMGD